MFSILDRATQSAIAASLAAAQNAVAEDCEGREKINRLTLYLYAIELLTQHNQQHAAKAAGCKDPKVARLGLLRAGQAVAECRRIHGAIVGQWTRVAV